MGTSRVVSHSESEADHLLWLTAKLPPKTTTNLTSSQEKLTNKLLSGAKKFVCERELTLANWHKQK